MNKISHQTKMKNRHAAGSLCSFRQELGFCSFIAWSFICCTSQICVLFGMWCSDNPRKCMQYATGATYNVDSTGTQPMILVCRVLLGDSKVTTAVFGFPWYFAAQA